MSRFTFDSLEELPFEIVQTDGERPQRPRFRRQNAHMFNQAFLNSTTSTNTMAPSPPSPTGDAALDYFSFTRKIKWHQMLPTFSDSSLPDRSQPQDNAAGPCENKNISNNSEYRWHPEVEHILKFRSSVVRETLTLPSRRRQSPAQNLVSGHEHVLQLSNLRLPPPLIPARTRRTFYSFSSSDSGVSEYHIEDVENPIPSHYAQEEASPSPEPLGIRKFVPENETLVAGLTWAELDRIMPGVERFIDKGPSGEILTIFSRRVPKLGKQKAQGEAGGETSHNLPNQDETNVQQDPTRPAIPMETQISYSSSSTSAQSDAGSEDSGYVFL